MSYGLAKRFSKRGKQFGTGEPEGIISPETADHAAGTSAMLPMLALGVPGSATSAVMLGGLMIWGLNPGPTLFTDRPDFVWGLIASMYVANIVAVVLVLFDRADVRGDPAHSVCDHRTDDRRRLLHRRVHGRRQQARPAAGRALRHRRLRVQEARLSDRARSCSRWCSATRRKTRFASR